jgi:hypothetical protein
LAPMPSAKVTTTVRVRPFTPANDRSANRKSESQLIMVLFKEATANL